MDIHTWRISFITFFECLHTFWFSLWFINQVCHTYFSNTGIGLRNVSFGLMLRSDIFERIFQCFDCLIDTSVKWLDSIDSMIDFSKLKVSFIGSIGILFDRLFEYFFSIINFVILFKYTGIAHDNSLIERIFMISKWIEILGLIEIKLLEFFLSHLEELLERETFDWFAFLFIHWLCVFLCYKGWSWNFIIILIFFCIVICIDQFIKLSRLLVIIIIQSKEIYK